MEPTAAHKRIEQLLGRPCPFAKDDPRYKTWLDLGLALTEAFTRFQSVYAEKALNAQPGDFARLAIETVRVQFDILASLLAASTTDLNSAAERESGIYQLAEMTLDWFQAQIRSGPRWMREEISIPTARLTLKQRAAHFSAEAYKLARESENRQDAPAAYAEPTQVGADKAEFPNRAAWLQRELDTRRWTVHDVERFNGPSYRTVRRMLEGKDVRGTVLEKLAQALSEKGRVSLGDIPNS